MVTINHRYLENRGSSQRHTVTGATGAPNTASIEELQERFSQMPIRTRRGQISGELLLNLSGGGRTALFLGGMDVAAPSK